MPACECEEALLPWKYQRPAFEALFQPPPQKRTHQPVFEFTGRQRPRRTVQTVPFRLYRHGRPCTEKREEITKCVILKIL